MEHLCEQLPTTINYILSKIESQNIKITNLNKILNIKNDIININDKLIKTLFEIYYKDLNNFVKPYIQQTKDEIKYYKDEIKYYKDEIKYYKDRTKCKVCYSNEINILFNSCGHMCCCESCFNQISQNNNLCPICLSYINTMRKIILPF